MALLFLTSANSIDTNHLPGVFASTVGHVTVGLGDGPQGINTVHCNTGGSVVYLNNISVATTNGFIVGFGVVAPAFFVPITVATVDPSGTNCFVAIDSDGSVAFTCTESGDSITSGKGAVVFGQRNYIELFMADLSGTPLCQVYVNGALAASGFVNVSGTTNPLVSVSVGCNSSAPGLTPPMVFDSFYACDTTTSINNTPLGPITVGIMQPGGAGQFSQWSPSGASQDWEAVDNVPPAGDNAYIFSAAAGQQCAVALIDAPTLPDVFGVSIVVSAKGGSTLQVGVGDGDSITYDPSFHTGGDYAISTFVFNTNPNTSEAWTFDDLSTLQAAVEYG